jgi:hypothetical protein
MDDHLTVCLAHPQADVMPRSGRCRACIEESNAEARSYLETAHTLAQGCREVIKYLQSVREPEETITMH